MEIDHPEYLAVIMLMLLSFILVTAFIVLKKWGPEKFEDKKH